MRTLRTLALTTALLIASAMAGFAQSDAQPKVETDNAGNQTRETVAVTAAPKPNLPESNPGVAFTPLGGATAKTPLAVPAGADSLVQLTAPLLAKGSGESALIQIYKRNNALFLEVLTAKGRQKAIRQNTVRLIAPYPDHPESLSVSMRYLQPGQRRGVMLVASDPAMHYVFVFPKGLGSKPTQQQFLTTAKNGTQSAYNFGGLDSRGYAMIKATVVSAGEIKPGDADQHFVWNGSRFIPRAAN